MKKIIVTIAAALMACICANAQFRVDVNASTTVYSFDNVSIDSKLAPAVRVYTNVLDNGRSGLELGLGYVQRKGVNNPGGVNSEMTINDLELPVRFFYNIKLGKILTITPLIGVYADYAIGGKTVLGVGSTNLVENSPFDGAQGMKRFDFGGDDEILLTIGEHLTAGVGVQYGLLNICKDSDIVVKPATAYLGIGWRF